MLHELGSLIVIFIYSPIFKLRFYQCKNILEKVTKLENIARERKKAASAVVNKSPKIIPNRKQPSLEQIPTPSSINTFLNPNKIGKNLAGKKIPNLSLKTLLPGIFASGTSAGPKLNQRHASEPQCNPKLPLIPDKILYK